MKLEYVKTSNFSMKNIINKKILLVVYKKFMKEILYHWNY